MEVSLPAPLPMPPQFRVGNSSPDRRLGGAPPLGRLPLPAGMGVPGVGLPAVGQPGVTVPGVGLSGGVYPGSMGSMGSIGSMGGAMGALGGMGMPGVGYSGRMSGEEMGPGVTMSVGSIGMGMGMGVGGQPRGAPGAHMVGGILAGRRNMRTRQETRSWDGSEEGPGNPLSGSGSGKGKKGKDPVPGLGGSGNATNSTASASGTNTSSGTSQAQGSSSGSQGSEGRRPSGAPREAQGGSMPPRAGSAESFEPLAHRISGGQGGREAHPQSAQGVPLGSIPSPRQPEAPRKPSAAGAPVNPRTRRVQQTSGGSHPPVAAAPAAAPYPDQTSEGAVGGAPSGRGAGRTGAPASATETQAEAEAGQWEEGEEWESEEEGDWESEEEEEGPGAGGLGVRSGSDPTAPIQAGPSPFGYGPGVPGMGAGRGAPRGPLINVSSLLAQGTGAATKDADEAQQRLRNLYRQRKGGR